MAVQDPAFAQSEAGQQLFGVEYYTLLAGPRGDEAGRGGYEADLFAGVTKAAGTGR